MSILDLFFPQKCAFCRTLCKEGLCESCEKSLPRTEKAQRDFSFARVAAPLYYTGAVREAVLRLKFSGGIGTVKGFAALMARCAAEEFGGEFDLVSFVPVSDKRRRERGWDQAERLATEMAKQWEAKAVRLLKKTRHTAAQSSLNDGAQREANVFGVYEAVNAEQIRGARILLVDDVVTTGATMKECVRVLRDAGASEVLGIALAAPLEKDKK